MLKVRHGDIFTTMGPRMIAHGCNAQGVMGSGVAVVIKKMMPYAYMAYPDEWNRRKLRLGQVVYAEKQGVHIANCITQLNYGRDQSTVYVDYGAVKGSLSQVALDVGTIFPEMPIHIPYIGGGLARGNKAKLLDIFAEVFEESDATLWLN